MKKNLLLTIASIMAVSMFAQTITELRIVNGNTVIYSVDINRIDSIVFAEVVAPEPPTPSSEGALYSEFSIGWGKIRFSKGNLQYQASTNTWRFAENQYDIVGYDNSAISSTNEGWIDLFGWGTGDNPTNISTDCSTYSTFTDWGVNAISNGGNEGGLWNTLGENEWEYIFNYHSWAKASVCDVNGFVILPDDFVLPFGVNWTEQTTNWRTNKYSADDWIKMEMAGAVFLPAAGARERETSTYSVGTYAYYWTNSSVSYPCEAYMLSLTTEANTGYGNRISGYAVRLVQYVEEE